MPPWTTMVLRAAELYAAGWAAGQSGPRRSELDLLPLIQSTLPPWIDGWLEARLAAVSTVRAGDRVVRVRRLPQNGFFAELPGGAAVAAAATVSMAVAGVLPDFWPAATERWRAYVEGRAVSAREWLPLWIDDGTAILRGTTWSGSTWDQRLADHVRETVNVPGDLLHDAAFIDGRLEYLVERYGRVEVNPVEEVYITIERDTLRWQAVGQWLLHDGELVRRRCASYSPSTALVQVLKELTEEPPAWWRGIDTGGGE